jgi:hypothetical protein
MDGVLVKWDGNYGEIQMPNGKRYPFIADVKEEKLHVGDKVVFDLSDKDKNYFHAINVKKFQRE